MINILFAFITSAAIGISFRGPLRSIPPIGLAGMLGYAANQAVVRAGAPQVLAAFIGAAVVGTVGELMARRLREPTTLFVVPGLFPLVPGLMAYNGMLLLAREELILAAQMLTRTIFYAGALAAGLVVPPAILRRWR